MRILISQFDQTLVNADGNEDLVREGTILIYVAIDKTWVNLDKNLEFDATINDDTFAEFDYYSDEKPEMTPTKENVLFNKDDATCVRYLMNKLDGAADDLLIYFDNIKDLEPEIDELPIDPREYFDFLDNIQNKITEYQEKMGYI